MAANFENNAAVADDSPGKQPQDYTGPLAMVTTLFFIWGFLTCMNDLLIPYFKNAFPLLSNFGVMLVQTAFFFAYFVGALAYFLISAASGDPIARIGHRNGILLGLLTSALGAFLFYPAAIMVSYPFFLVALFVLALGFTMLQISANPYVAVLGSENTASSRLNLSQGFNSLGTTIAPIVGSILIFSQIGKSGGVDNVKVPYLVIGGVLILMALVFALIRLPRIQTSGTLERKPVSLRFRHVRLGMAAIFFYVGAEVSIGSMMILYFALPEIGGMSESMASLFVTAYWGGAMIGRFLGAISLSQSISAGRKALMMAGVALGLFALILFVIHFYDGDYGFEALWPFLLLIALNFGAFHLGRSLPHFTLALFAMTCVCLLVATMLFSGKIAIWAVVGIGLFNSIMWSNIFTLAIAGLGKYKSQASSLLVMMIIGGAVIPPLQGALSDVIGVQASFVLPIFCYLYLVFYGLNGYQIQNPGVQID